DGGVVEQLAYLKGYEGGCRHDGEVLGPPPEQPKPDGLDRLDKAVDRDEHRHLGQRGAPHREQVADDPHDSSRVDVDVERGPELAERWEILVEEPLQRTLRLAEPVDGVGHGEEDQRPQPPLDGEDTQDHRIAKGPISKHNGGLLGRPRPPRVPDHEGAAPETPPRLPRRSADLKPSGQPLVIGWSERLVAVPSASPQLPAG